MLFPNKNQHENFNKDTFNYSIVDLNLKTSSGLKVIPLIKQKNPDAKIVHYTLGTPSFDKFHDTSMASYWKKHFRQLLQGIGKKTKI